MSVMRSFTYDDFKKLISLSTTEQLFHFEASNVFIVWARTISPTSYVVVFQTDTKPASFATDFPGSTVLDQPLQVS
jgi:hypothetical protein